MHKLPNLYRNRLGTYYLRITIAGREIKRSLGTKEPALAKKAALAFALAKAGGTVPLRATVPSPTAVDRTPLAPTETTGNKPGHSTFFQDAETCRATTENEDPMLTIPTAFTKFDVLLPNGIKLFGINDDDEAQRAAIFLRETLKVAGIEPSHYMTVLEEAVEATKAKQAAQAPTAGKSKLFSKVARMYLDEKRLDNGGKTLEDKQRTFGTFVELFGDLDFNGIGAEQAIAFKQRLLGQSLSIVRINSKLSHLKELFRWAVNQGLRHTGNPFESMRVSTKAKVKQQTQSYQPFTADELQAIFDPATYDDFMNKPDYRWLPWLAVHTGARIEELASLSLNQIRTDGEIVYLDIQQGKNLNSVRKIPLHNNLMQSGFIDYVKDLQKQGKTRLFPHLIAGKNGYSKNCSRRFAQYLDKIGIKSPQKTFHSFRSTFITRMSELNVHPAMLMAIVGHFQQAKVDLSSPHFSNYQGAKLLSALQDTVNTFDLMGANNFTKY